MAKRQENTSNFAPLGRLINWIEYKNRKTLILWGFMAVCVALLMIDLFYEKHGYTEIEARFGIYAIAGFVACFLVILVARLSQIILHRDEGFYGPSDTQSEAHPKADLEIKKRGTP